MMDPALSALVALLLPAASFLILAIVAPLRRLGRPAAYLSVLFAAGALAAALQTLRLTGSATGFSEWLWGWIPAEAGPLASVGVLADGDLGHGDGDDEQREDDAAQVTGEAREGHQVDVDRVQHQLDAEQDADRVAPGHHAEEPDGEHQRPQREIGAERHQGSLRAK